MGHDLCAALSITIVGGGYAGAVAAIKLLDQPDARVVVTVVESCPEIGRGAAYSTPDQMHLVNGPSRIFGLHPDRPDHLVDWLVRNGEAYGWPLPADIPNASPPRWLYGTYVQSELERAAGEAAHRSSFRAVEGRVVGLARSHRGWSVRLADGRSIGSDRVILATGVFQSPPSVEEAALVVTGRYVHSFWEPERLDALVDAEHLLLIGSSLSMVDAVAAMERRGYRGRYTVVSRRGQVVDARQVGAVEPWRDFLGDQPHPATTLQLLQRVKAERRAIAALGLDWQGLPLSIKPHIKSLWKGASDTERLRFARHLRAFWDVTAHRAAPESYAAVETAKREGRFAPIAGRVVSMAARDEGTETTLRRRRDGASIRINADAIINCRGHQLHDWRRIDDPFVQHLLSEGFVRPHSTGFGIDATTAGEVVDRSGSVQADLLAIGHPLRGVAWESSSIGEQLAQAIELATHLTAQVAEPA